MSVKNPQRVDTHEQRTDAALATAVRAAMPSPDRLPGFAGTLAAAERRHRARRRRRPAIAAAVAVVGIIGVVLLQPGQHAPPGDALQLADLYERAAWVAPSDVLLPERETDLYRALPAIPVSTIPAEGALL